MYNGDYVLDFHSFLHVINHLSLRDVPGSMVSQTKTVLSSWVLELRNTIILQLQLCK